MLIDTHAHLNFGAFREDADEVIKRSLEKGMIIVNAGSQYSTSARAVKYAEKYPGKLFAAVGTHPIHLHAGNFSYKDQDDELLIEEIATIGEDVDFEKYRELALKKEVVAIGEVGLDYHHFKEEDDREMMKTKQKEVLLGFIKLANEVGKPVMIHCWDAYEDLLEILENNPVKKTGIIHSFIGGYRTAKRFIELGYKIGLNGIVTYGISYDRLIKETDLSDIVLETDCPYLAPGPKKGERNEPLYVAYVAEKISGIKGISIEEVARVTSETAKRVFCL